MEGLLSAGPTPSSFLKVSNKIYKTKHLYTKHTVVGLWTPPFQRGLFHLLPGSHPLSTSWDTASFPLSEHSTCFAWAAGRLLPEGKVKVFLSWWRKYRHVCIEAYASFFIGLGGESQVTFVLRHCHHLSSVLVAKVWPHK